MKMMWSKKSSVNKVSESAKNRVVIFERPLCLALAFLFVFTAATVAEEAEVRPNDKPKADSPKPQSLFDGKTLKNWSVIKKNDFELHGKVHVKDGAILVEKGKPASGIAYTGKPPRMNYELALDAKRIDGSDFFCGLTFPVDKSYCTLIIGGWGGGSTGLSNVDEASAIDNETTGYTEFKQNQWYKIRLRVTEKKIEAWIDKEQIVDLDASDRKFSIWWEQEPARPLGIATWNTSAALRNIRLTVLDSPAKKPAGKQGEKSKND
jgi:hypothetical protein